MDYKFNAIASEDLRNPSICIYDNVAGAVRNIKNQFDLFQNVCVYIDICNQVDKGGNEIKEDIIKKGTMVRCTRVCIINQ